MHPDRMYSLVKQGVSVIGMSATARDSQKAVVKTIGRNNQATSKHNLDRVKRSVTYTDGKGSVRIKDIPVTLPRVSFLEGAAA